MALEHTYNFVEPTKLTFYLNHGFQDVANNIVEGAYNYLWSLLMTH